MKYLRASAGLALLSLASCGFSEFESTEGPLRAIVAESLRPTPSAARVRHCFTSGVNPDQTRDALEVIAAATGRYGMPLTYKAVRRESREAEIRVAFSNLEEGGPAFVAIVADDGEGWKIRSIDVEPLRAAQSSEGCGPLISWGGGGDG